MFRHYLHPTQRTNRLFTYKKPHNKTCYLKDKGFYLKKPVFDQAKANGSILKVSNLNDRDFTAGRRWLSFLNIAKL
jgi:hypothetical protein